MIKVWTQPTSQDLRGNWRRVTVCIKCHAVMGLISWENLTTWTCTNGHYAPCPDCGHFKPPTREEEPERVVLVDHYTRATARWVDDSTWWKPWTWMWRTGHWELKDGSWFPPDDDDKKKKTKPPEPVEEETPELGPQGGQLVGEA